MHGQCIEHLVGDDRTDESIRQFIQPMHPTQQMRQVFAHERLLARAQVGTHLEDRITFRQAAELLQLGQHIHCQFTAARAQLQYVRCALRHDLRHLPRHGASEQRREFRRGNEVACFAKLVRASSVIAQPG